MAASIIQEKNAENTGAATSVSVTLAGAVVAGHALHVITDYDSASKTSTFSDGTNTYTSNLDTTGDGGGDFIAQGYALNCAATTPSVKVTWSSATTSYGGIWVREVGGCSTSAIDNHAAALTTASATPTTTLTLNATAGLISSVGADLAGNTAVTVGSGWTTGLTTGWKDNSATNCAASESQHFTSSGSKSITYGSTAGNALLAASMSFADASGTVTDVYAPRRPGMRIGTPLSRLRGQIAQALSSASSVAAAADVASSGAATASLTGAAESDALGTSVSASFASLTGTLALSATGAAASQATAPLGGTGNLTAASISASQAQAQGAGAGALSAQAASVAAAQGQAQGAAAASAIGSASSSAAADLEPQSSGAISADGSAASGAVATLTGAAESDALGTSVSVSFASLTGTLALSAAGTSASTASADLEPLNQGAAQAVAASPSVSFASLTGTLALSAVGAGGASASADLEPFVPSSAAQAAVAAGAPPGFVPDEAMGKGIGPHKRPGQVFGEQDPWSPRLSSRAEDRIIAPQPRTRTDLNPPAPVTVTPPAAAIPSAPDGELVLLLVAIHSGFG